MTLISRFPTEDLKGTMLTNLHTKLSYSIIWDILSRYFMCSTTFAPSVTFFAHDDPSISPLSIQRSHWEPIEQSPASWANESNSS